MMTTMAALLGAIFIGMRYGVGGKPVSELITLYPTPVFYTYLAALQTWLGKSRKVAAVHPVPAPTGD